MMPRVAKRAWLFMGMVALLLACSRRVAPTKNNMGDLALTQRMAQAEKSLAELDVRKARVALDAILERRLDVDLLRVRLALAVGDCQGAVTMLSAYGVEMPQPRAPLSTPPRSQYPTELHAVAHGCSRAMAGAEVAVDDARGVWVRFQNSHDRVLLPLIADAADRAARAIGVHLGTMLPRPLRIELVADLASLAAVTGLPLEAAEATGTIAIARWGKVTLVSPRATPDGYPWQDTLAHELAHLVVARQSRDSAPLWLQEGIAKREETRWRESLPLDAVEDSHGEAKSALIEGRSIGIDRIGASIALLPTPRAAETAYAEVRDFLEYWIQKSGDPALMLLLRDLGGLGAEGVDSAMVSVSGYTLGQWILRWQRSLLDETRANKTGRGSSDADEPSWGLDASRRLRLAEVLEDRRHFRVAAQQLAPFATTPKMPPELAYRSALARLVLGQLDTARGFVEPARVIHLDGTWLAIRGRVLASMGDAGAAERAFLQSLAFAPTLEKAACRGFSLAELEPLAVPIAAPQTEPWLSLCRAARGQYNQ